MAAIWYLPQETRPDDGTEALQGSEASQTMVATARELGAVIYTLTPNEMRGAVVPQRRSRGVSYVQSGLSERQGTQARLAGHLSGAEKAIAPA